MSLGSWDPDTEQAKAEFKLEGATLQRYIELSRTERLEHLATELEASEQQLNAQMMHLPEQMWFNQADTFSDDDIEHLMRFFTKAEQLPGWDAGPNSPVIWLGKILKRRGSGIPRELAQWIKDNSDNRFLPHGPLL